MVKLGDIHFERTKMAIRNDNNGKHAITRFKIIEKYNFKNKTVACLIECWLELVELIRLECTWIQ